MFVSISSFVKMKTVVALKSLWGLNALVDTSILKSASYWLSSQLRNLILLFVETVEVVGVLIVLGVLWKQFEIIQMSIFSQEMNHLLLKRSETKTAINLTLH